MSDYMKTYAERKAHMQKLGKLVETGEIPIGEWFKIVYHWTMFEIHLYKSNRSYDKMIKHGKWLNNATEVIDFRQEMNSNL